MDPWRPVAACDDLVPSNGVTTSTRKVSEG